MLTKREWNLIDLATGKNWSTWSEFHHKVMEELHGRPIQTAEFEFTTLRSMLRQEFECTMEYQLDIGAQT